MRSKRILCACLSALLLFGTLCPAAAADTAERRQAPAAQLKLGNTSEMMLAGGGRMVQTDEYLYFLAEADGCIYRTDGETTEPVFDGAASCLNYIDGLLFFATAEEAGFALWQLDPETGARTKLLSFLAGTLKQFYAAEGGTLWFLAGQTVYRMEADAAPETVVQAEGLCSFVPTAYGPVYATGSLFDYDIYLDGTLLAGGAEDYYVLTDEAGARLVYTKDGIDRQIALGDDPAALEQEAFVGYGLVSTDELFSGDPSEAPTQESVSVEPISAVKRNAVPTAYDTRAVSQGCINIALRAYQMTDIEWTAQADVKGWRGNVTYYEGQTYTGLPYGQPIYESYVPWNASFTEFIEAVNNAESDFYTTRSRYVDGLVYATDCSGFVSWAWQTPYRLNTVGLSGAGYATVVSSSDYAAAQIGDCLNDVYNHAVLITNLHYDDDGAIVAIELCEANVNGAKSNCCSREWYGTGYAYSLADLQYKYFANGYKLYRSIKRDSVTFTEDPNVTVSHETPSVSEPSKAMLHYGVDISQWQGDIDWATASQHLDFAIIRSQHGVTYLDTKWEENLAGCEKYGVPYGVYVYATAVTVEQALAEAALVLERLDGREIALPIFYDVEDEATNLKLSNEALFEVVSAFCTAVEDAGYRAGIYSSTSCWITKMPDARYAQWVRWVAQWNTVCTYPGGMNLWQYSATGHIPGIPNVVDLDVWIGDLGDDSYSFVMDRVAPTCVESGKTIYASTDGTYYWTEPIPALGHSFKNGSCLRCGAQDPSPDFAVSFNDVAEGAWYYDAVVYALHHRLFTGTSADLFRPDGTMTRAMMAAMLYRCAGSPQTAAPDFSAYPDGASVSDYARTPMAWAIQMELINGIKDGNGIKLSPLGLASRAQVATVLMRFIESGLVE